MAKRIAKVIPFLASAALLVGLTGCGTSNTVASKEDPNAPITLKIAWWGTQDRADRTQKVIDLFKKDHPNVTVETEYAGSKDYWTKMATEAAGGALPDVMQMDYGYIGDYSARNLLAPLDSYVQSGALNLKDVDPSYTNGGVINGKLYAISLGTNAPAAAIDPAAFNKAGIPIPKDGYTYDDLLNTARQLKSKLGEDFYPLDGQATTLTPLDFGYYLRQKGASKYNKDGTALGYDNDQFLTDFFNLELQVVKEGLMAPPEISKAIKAEPDTLFVKGSAAYHGFTSNLITAYTGYAKRPLQLIPFPSLAGGQEGNYLKPSQFFSVPSTSKHKDMAVKFIDFFTNSIDANNILLAERGVPVSSKIREAIFPKLDDATKQQFTYIEYVQKHSRTIDPPAPKGDSQVNDIYNRLEEAVLYRQTTPADAAKQFRQQANEVLSQNKK